MNSFVQHLKVALISHRGKVRERNEDCVGAINLTTASDCTSAVVLDGVFQLPAMVIVADGLGGHKGGQFASGATVKSLIGISATIQGEAELVEALRSANRLLFDEMAGRPDLSRMGATVAGLVINGDGVLCFNVGDSRVYEIVPGPYVRLLSTDDVLRPEGYDYSSRTGLSGHRVTQSLGGTSQYVEVHPHVNLRPNTAGSVFLICSDGLTDMLDQDAIEASIDADISTFANTLFRQAMAAGGADNISVCVVQIMREKVEQEHQASQFEAKGD